MSFSLRLNDRCSGLEGSLSDFRVAIVADFVDQMVEDLLEMGWLHDVGCLLEDLADCDAVGALVCNQTASNL